mgnify:CR=1 FL=1
MQLQEIEADRLQRGDGVPQALLHEIPFGGEVGEDPVVTRGDRRIRRMPTRLPKRFLKFLEAGPHALRIRFEFANDLGKIGYAPPCPDPGKPHQYWFRIYAVDRRLDLPGGASPRQVREAMRKHVLRVSELMGTYARPTPPLPPPPPR